MKLKPILENIINERKNIGIVYHFTDLHGLVSIVNDNRINISNATRRYRGSVSTTRDKNFSKHRSGKTIGAWPFFAIVLDGNRLSDRYQVRSNDDTVGKWGNIDLVDRYNWGDEMEETWYGDILKKDRGFANVKKYIIKIIITKQFQNSLINHRDRIIDQYKDDNISNLFGDPDDPELDAIKFMNNIINWIKENLNREVELEK